MYLIKSILCVCACRYVRVCVCMHVHLYDIILEGWRIRMVEYTWTENKINTNT